MKPASSKTALRKLIKQAASGTPPWVGSGVHSDILLGFAARIIRNIKEAPFPGWSTAEDRQKVFNTLSPALLSNKKLGVDGFAEMSDLTLDERRLLLERKLISPCMAARQDGCFVGCSKKGDISVLINEEEHLVVRCFEDGSDPHSSFRRFRSIAKSLDDAIPFARDPRRGVLGSVPAEVGDGMQLYFLLHLPGIVLAGMMEQVTRGAEKLAMSLTPLHGNEENSGNCYLLGAGPARADKTEVMFEHLDDIAQELIAREWQIRHKLFYSKPDEVLDVIGRSYGLLHYAHRLTYSELQHNISFLRLGAALELIKTYGMPSSYHLCELFANALLEFAPGMIAHSGITDEDEQERARAQAVLHMLSCADLEFLSPLLDASYSS